MEFNEFKREILKTEGKGRKKFKITGSFGVYDIFKKIRKNKWYNIGRPVTEKEFYAIVRGVNELLAENIANGIEVQLPCRMGILELRKQKCGVSIVKDKLRINYPVDWSETLKLWYEDAELRKAKVLKRREIPYIYKVKYNKSHAKYNNKSFYYFVLNSFIKQALAENIKNGKIDALWDINKYD